MDKQKINTIIREAYGKIAQRKDGCGCGCTSCVPDSNEFAKSIGYSATELEAIPDGANLALSCGNPTALASLKAGEVVLDLGSGAGFDCFIAANKVGINGKVIGVDMTPEMVEKARENAKKNAVANVEFRLGEIENLPAEDNSVDVVISNCVINLSADKPRVFREVCRVLKPGGRIAISDIALLRELPRNIQESMAAYVSCVAGAILVDDYKKVVEQSGLRNVRISIKGSSACTDSGTNDPLGKVILDGLDDKDSLENSVVSVYIEAQK